jgi:hypothetical protein
MKNEKWRMESELPYARSNTPVSRFFRTSSALKHCPFIAT